MTKNLYTSKTKKEGGTGKELESSNSTLTKPLHLLMMERLLLEDTIEQQGGEITDEQDLIWQQTELAIKDKLDAYGHLFDELAAEKKKLQDIKSSGLDRVRAAEARIQNLEKSLKSRLNALSGGNALRGHIYSFHPFMSKHTFISEPEKLKPNEAYLTVEIREDYWNEIHPDPSNPNFPDYPFRIIKRAGKVSELDSGNKALQTSLTPSVRIT